MSNLVEKRHAYENVVLGFLEPATDETLDPKNFASKAGGLPIWLHRDPSEPPPVPRCSNCLQPEKFLLQVYAPVEAESVGHDQGFHRVLYVSVCRNTACLSGSNGVTVLRGQLARQNPFYPFNANDDSADRRVDSPNPTCNLCGYHGGLLCTACRRVRYCSTCCQKDDWACGHKNSCAKLSVTDSLFRNDSKLDQTIEVRRRQWRYPEMEIVTEKHCTPPQSESDDDDDDDDDGDDDPRDGDDQSENENNINWKHEEGVTRECSNTSSARKANNTAGVEGTFQDADEDELPEELFDGRALGRERDRVADKFSRVVKYEADQVVRYERGGTPLWGGRIRQCQEKDVGTCGKCGNSRVFELQVMPQLVYLLDQHRHRQENLGDGQISLPASDLHQLALRLRNDADWTTIVVMTCSHSCVIEEGQYVQEFAWVQQTRQP